MKVLIAAGGTGGHIMPALAVAEALIERRIATKDEILFVGSGKEIENRLIEGAGYSLKQIPSLPLIGRGFQGVLAFLKAFPATFRLTRLTVVEHRPMVVLAFGGYPSMGPALVSFFRGLPLILQEQNATAGLANKVLSLLARRVFAVPGARGFFKKSHVVFQPNPVRKELSLIPPWHMPAPGEKLRLLIMGGSQGAVTLNTAVLAMLPKLKELGVSIFHQTGQLDLERVQQAYRDAGFPAAEIVSFTSNITAEYRKAHLIIARAGAMSVWEISAAGRPAIFVPLRIARSHQSENARHLVEMGAAQMIEQEPGFEAKLEATVCSLLGSPETLIRMGRKMREASRTGEESPAESIARCASDLAAGRLG